MPLARDLAALPVLAVTAIASLFATVSPRPALGAATIVVDSPGDDDANNAVCSLREAIIAANTNASYHGCTAIGAGVGDTITFNLGTGTPTINIGSTPLPTITEAVTIDGGAGRVELRGPGGPPVSQHHGLNVGTNGFGTVIRDLVIDNFADDGVFIDADEVDVFGCFIGTDATGTTAMPNQGFGVQVGGGNGVRIGGATSGGNCTGDCNVISGAVGSKANVLLDVDVTGAVVHGNFIGTDVTGTATIANQAPGVIDKGSFDRIGGMNGTTPGGSCTGDCNLISGNKGNSNPTYLVDQTGILIDSAAVGSIIQGNFIGTDVTGNDAIGNGISADFSFGILSLSSTTGVTIGGTTAQARNVVSGNLGYGIQVSSPSTTVQGNYIGTNSAGTVAVPDSGTGITVMQTNGVTIGGTTAGAGNLISGATHDLSIGIGLLKSTNTQIVGNLIGTAADGTTPLPNQAGVVIAEGSTNNTVGGLAAAAANTIAFNIVYGVLATDVVDAASVYGNSIRGNSIYANGVKGIELLSGANANIGFPTIVGIGPLHGTSCAECTVEIFSDSESQGRVFEGSVFTTTGNWTFNGPVSGPHITATNTDLSHNTSKFSAPFFLSTQTPTPSATVTTPTATATRTATRTSTSSGTPTSPSTPTPSPSATSTTTQTATATASATATPTVKPLATGTASSAPTNTRTAPPTASVTSTVTRTATATGSAPATSTVNASATSTGSPSPSNTTASPSATRTVTSTPSASPPPTVERTATATVSSTATSLPSSAPSATPTDTPALLASATPSATTVLCTGDCNGSGTVSIDELILGVNIALGTRLPSACPAFENADGSVDIAQLIRAVNNSLTGCGSASEATEVTRPR